MGRWTIDEKEARHLATIMSKTGIRGTAVLRNGEQAKGLILPSDCANNAGEGGAWKYRANVRVGERVFDALDVAEIILCQKH